MIEHISLDELESGKLIESIENDSALIVDLTDLDILRAVPNFSSHNLCSCKDTKIEDCLHCIKCGTSYDNLRFGLNSYERYSILYKFLEIHSKKFKTIAVISRSIVPTDFVGSLNRIYYTFLPEMPFRRNIMHISNDIVHTDDFLVKAELSNNPKDRLTHISIFSNNSGVLEVHKNKIIHATRISPVEYTSLILSSCGLIYKFVIS